MANASVTGGRSVGAATHRVHYRSDGTLGNGNTNTTPGQLAAARRAWLEWHQYMCQALADQGNPYYTPADYAQRYPEGDGIPRDFSGQPYEPLEWRHP